MSFHSDLVMKLGGMLPDQFEQLCCRLLPRLSEDYRGLEPSTNRDGKTTKGVADAYKRLDDGSYTVFVFTTQQSSITAKVKADLEKIAASGAPITKVVLCVNVQETLENDLEYMSIAQNNGWQLEIFTLHQLAHILEAHPDLLKEFLDLDLESALAGEKISDGQFLIGERLRSLRQELDLQPSELMALISVTSEKAYLEMESNSRECGTPILGRLHDAFGVLPSWLITGKPPKYEIEDLLWWQVPEQCLGRILELRPESLYFSVQVRKPGDWIGHLRDLKDGLFSLLGRGDFGLLERTGPLHLGILAKVGPYRYRIYDLRACLVPWEWHSPMAVRSFYQFLDDLIDLLGVPAFGLALPGWDLDGALYAGYLHPIEVFRQLPSPKLSTWPQDIVNLDLEPHSGRKYHRRYGRWFSQVQNHFRQVLAVEES